jgi:dTDP-4-amino-4,6-dideoxygalactose transaminase
MTVYDIVDVFEKLVAEYAGAKYGVAVNSCTSGIMLSALYRKITKNPGTDVIDLPKHTYVGVPYSLINAGYKINFVNMNWKGNYNIEPINVIDSARRFTKGMYVKGSLYCLSFHETKHLSIGDGGMILTDDKDAHDALRQMRFDGRTPGLSVFDDQFVFPAHHCHMKPDVATRGVMLMAAMKDFNEDLPEKYPDLSKHKIFTKGY